jgi:SAM-dependent methyltransferase
VSLPLAARGYEVRGIDISAEMVRLAQAKVRPEWRARYVQGDVRDIPDIDGSVDAVVVSKLLQHVQDWQEACRQLIRVVRPACPIAHINERGAFGNAVRRCFAKRADELGFTGRYFGLNPHSGLQLAAFMESQGCQTIPVDAVDLRWETVISYGEAISRIQERLFAEFWYLPAEIHDRIVTDTITWIEAQPDGGNTVEHLKPYLIVTVFRTPDHDPA